jgi:catechol 2,3-dioxygenase-like lactoylglutathione lyase family enzyme
LDAGSDDVEASMNAPIPIKQVKEIILVSRDVEASRRLYRDILGLPMPEAPDRLNLARIGTQFLGTAAEGVMKHLGFTGGVHLGLEVDRADFDRAVAQLREHGVEVTIRNQTPGYMETAAGVGAYFLDPDGNLIELWAAMPAQGDVIEDPVAELAEKLAGRIGDFGRYRALIREIGRRGLAAGAPLLATIIGRNAAYEAVLSGYEDVRLALEALEALRDRDAVPLVRRLLASNHFSDAAAAAAIRYLAAAGDRAGAAALLPFLGHAARECREAAAHALGTLRAGIAAEPLAQALGDHDAAVAEAAAVALGRIGDRRGKPLLESALQRRPSIAVVEALAAVGDSDSGVLLTRQADHPDQAMRADILTALAALDLPRFGGLIWRRAEIDPDPAVREAGIRAVAECDEG